TATREFHANFALATTEIENDRTFGQGERLCDEVHLTLELTLCHRTISARKVVAEKRFPPWFFARLCRTRERWFRRTPRWWWLTFNRRDLRHRQRWPLRRLRFESRMPAELF